MMELAKVMLRDIAMSKDEVILTAVLLALVTVVGAVLTIALLGVAFTATLATGWPLSATLEPVAWSFAIVTLLACWVHSARERPSSQEHGYSDDPI